MQINLENLTPALEAIEGKPLTSPRKLKFKGIETISWDDVDKTFKGFSDAYYKQTGTKRPEKDYTQFRDCPEKMRKWISSHSLLGNPNGKTFREGRMLPVVNPHTGKLNRGAVLMANIFASRIKGVAEGTKKKAKEFLSSLYKKHFKDNVSNENLGISDEDLLNEVMQIIEELNRED